MSSRNAYRTLPWVVGGLLGAAAAVPAAAQGNAQGLLENRFVISVGGFAMGTEIKANLNGESNQNPEVDFDKTFGKANDATRGRVDALWRITPNHDLRFVYFNNSTTRNAVLTEDVEWGEYVFKSGSNVESKNKFEVYELAYEYRFIQRPTWELVGTLGVHATDLAVRIQGTADVLDANGNVTSTQFSTKTASVLAPLPVIGLRAGWVVAPDWYLTAQGQFFSLNTGGYDGNWSDVGVGATWMFHRNFGLGLGYNRFYTRVEFDDENFDGRLKFGYNGLRVWLTGTF